MSERRPVSARAIIQILASLGVLLAVVALVTQLRQAQPYEAPEFIIEAAEDPDDPASEIVTCERTLPDRPVSDEVETLPPLGRVTSSEVIACPDLFDGRVVVYVGEVIGDVLERDDGAWVLMNDDDYALESGPLDSHGEFRGYNSGLSVWLDGDLPELVTQAGGPAHRGDVLRVRGVVRRADPKDGGGLTIRAFQGRVLEPAVELSQPVNRAQAIAAVALSVVALGVIGADRLRSRRP